MFADDVLQSRRTYNLDLNTELTEPYSSHDPRYHKLQASASTSKLTNSLGIMSASPSKLNLSKVILSPLKDSRTSVKGANFVRMELRRSFEKLYRKSCLITQEISKRCLMLLDLNLIKRKPNYAKISSLS